MSLTIENKKQKQSINSASVCLITTIEQKQNKNKYFYNFSHDYFPNAFHSYDPFRKFCVRQSEKKKF